jgi:hypothetical protein
VLGAGVAAAVELDDGCELDEGCGCGCDGDSGWGASPTTASVSETGFGAGSVAAGSVAAAAAADACGWAGEALAAAFWWTATYAPAPAAVRHPATSKPASTLELIDLLLDPTMESNCRTPANETGTSRIPTKTRQICPRASARCPRVTVAVLGAGPPLAARIESALH